MCFHPEGHRSWNSGVQFGWLGSSLHKLEFLEFSRMFSIIAAEACTFHFIKDEKESGLGSSPPLILRALTPLKFSL